MASLDILAAYYVQLARKEKDKNKRREFFTKVSWLPLVCNMCLISLICIHLLEHSGSVSCLCSQCRILIYLMNVHLQLLYYIVVHLLYFSYIYHYSMFVSTMYVCIYSFLMSVRISSRVARGDICPL